MSGEKTFLLVLEFNIFKVLIEKLIFWRIIYSKF